MFTDLASIRADLKARLEPELPASWRIVRGMSDVIEAMVPVLYFQFEGINGDVNGQPLGRDQVACAIDVVIATAGTTDAAEDDVDNYVLRLTQTIQQSSDIYWSTARKQRLEGGQYAWRVSTTVLTTTPPSEE